MWIEIHSMATIQIILEPELLTETDHFAKSAKLNRSALIREALKAHLKHLKIREMEERERKAYEAIPDNREEALFWEKHAAWPED